MQGFMNKAIQCFVRDAYGRDAWTEIATGAGVESGGFDAMLTYEDALTYRVIGAACERLAKPSDVMLEDLGTYLVSHPTTAPLRRLLRFGGETFLEFLHSLDDLHDRARLALPDLRLPALEVQDHADGAFSLLCPAEYPGFGHVLVGVLRAMADDYGALVFLEHRGGNGAREVIAITLLDARFSEGRIFDLAAGTGT